MMYKLLAVMPERLNYLSCYEVTVADSFAQAKERIEQMESQGTPFDSLDLPAGDENRLWEFLNWMRATGRNYPFSVFGDLSTESFWALCEKCRSLGFHFNT